MTIPQIRNVIYSASVAIQDSDFDYRDQNSAQALLCYALDILDTLENRDEMMPELGSDNKFYSKNDWK